MLGLDIPGLDMLGLDMLGLDVLGLDVLGLDVLGLDVLGLDVLGLDMLGTLTAESATCGVLTGVLQEAAQGNVAILQCGANFQKRPPPEAFR